MNKYKFTIETIDGKRLYRVYQLKQSKIGYEYKLTLTTPDYYEALDFCRDWA